jgi:hypothetical protein
LSRKFSSIFVEKLLFSFGLRDFLFSFAALEKIRLGCVCVVFAYCFHGRKNKSLAGNGIPC